MSEGSRHSESLSTRLHELDREIGDVVERSARALLDQIGDRLRQGSEELLHAVQKLSLDLPPSFLADNELVQRLLRPEDDRGRRGRAVDRLLTAVARVDGAGSQADLLNALLEEARAFASRTAFLLTRPDGVHGWAGRGFGDNVDPQLAQLRLTYEDDPSWPELARGDGVVALDGERCARFASRLGAAAAAEGILVPFVLHGQLGGALYADRLESDETLEQACLQILTHAASQALETLSVRGGGVSPTLKPGSASAESEEMTEDDAMDGTAVAGTAVAAAAATPETEDVAVTEDVAPAAEDADASSAPAADFTPSSEIDSFELEPTEDVEQDLAAIDRPPEEPSNETDNVDDLWGDTTDSAKSGPAAYEQPPPGVGQPTVRLDLSQLPGREPAAPPPEDDMPPEIPGWELDRGAPADDSPVAEPETAASAEAPDYRLEGSTQEVEPVTAMPMDVGEDPTLMSPKTALFTPPTEPEPKPADAAPATAEVAHDEAPAKSTAVSGSSEVVPPADIDGPGLAFAGGNARTTDEEAALHEEARRLARLLVSEIKLYNEEVIEEGRREGNIYRRLKDDIDRSRQMYRERIDSRLHDADDYFHQELVQRLAGGDTQLLGM